MIQRASCLLALSSALLFSSPARGAEPSAPEPAAAATSTAGAPGPTGTSSAAADGRSDPLFREERPPRPVGLEPERLLLSLPGSIVELAFVPLIPILVAFEREKVVDRIIDLFTNDELTFAAAPIVEPFNISGLGLGGVAAWNAPLGSPDRIIFIGLGRLNGDRLLNLTVGRRVPPLSGRVIDFAARYEVDRDIGWFGFGSEQNFDEQRLLRRDEIFISAGLSELFPQVINLDGAFQVSYRRRGLFTGSGSQAPLLEPGGDVPLPPGFGRTFDYMELGFRFRVDTRDGLGRTTRGAVWTVQGNASTEIDPVDPSNPSGGFLGSTQLTWFFPVLPRNRVLVLSAGLSGATPILDGEEVALHQLVNLGGPNTLRGYQPDRFLDELGWWATAEYRFLLSDYGGSIVGFSGAIFADVGKVANSVGDLVRGTLPWSVGLGIRAETDILNLGRVQVAYSPDGIQFSVGVEEFF